MVFTLSRSLRVHAEFAFANHVFYFLGLFESVGPDTERTAPPGGEPPHCSLLLVLYQQYSVIMRYNGLMLSHFTCLSELLFE